MLYNSMEHGFDLNTFYRRVRDQGPTILIIADAGKNVRFALCLRGYAVAILCSSVLTWVVLFSDVRGVCLGIVDAN